MIAPAIDAPTFRRESVVPVIHVVIPFLDEDSTLETVVDRLEACRWPAGWSCRLVLVDDGSGHEATSHARTLVENRPDPAIVLLRHDANRGKGAALRTGFEDVLSTAGESDLAGVQDADLEYDPTDLISLIEAMESGDPPPDAAFGNRWNDQDASTIRRVHRFGNRMLTHFSNAATGLAVNDMECCYKLIRIPMLRTIAPELDEDRFAIEPQLAATLARHGARVVDIPVSYDPRSYSQGKKIGLRDAMAAIRTIIREWGKSRRLRRMNG